jgi:hypothetical protein
VLTTATVKNGTSIYTLKGTRCISASEITRFLQSLCLLKICPQIMRSFILLHVRFQVSSDSNKISSFVQEDEEKDLYQPGS